MVSLKLREKIIFVNFTILFLMAVLTINSVDKTFNKFLKNQLILKTTASLSHQSINLFLTDRKFELVNLLNQEKIIDEDLIYAFITDVKNNVYAHTFNEGFPLDLLKANELPLEKEYHILLVQLEGQLVYDIIYPIIVGNSRIGDVRIGIKRDAIQSPINEILLIITIVVSILMIILVIIVFLFSKWISSPIEKLQKSITKVIYGDLSTRIDLIPFDCSKILECNNKDCPAHPDNRSGIFVPCWNLVGIFSFDSKFECKDGICTECKIYKRYYRDEINKLSISFNSMAERLDKNQQNLLLGKIELKEQKKLLENMNNYKSEFIANISHEIRTPLYSIVGYADLMLAENLDLSSKENIYGMKESCNLLLSLINNILDLSKIESGQIEIDDIPFSLKDLMNNVSRTAEVLGKLGKKNLDIKEIIPADISEYIRGDQIRILQMLNNLISNAVKFTESGTIEYGISLANNNMLEFYVKDSGIGIPTDKQNNIFENFVQASSDTERVYGGTGLGLPISKKLVELMGGNISVTSKSGEGSTFTISIPYRPVESIQMKKSEVSRITDNNSNKNILLVDDHKKNQTITKKILKKSGYTVNTADNGIEAVNKYRSDPTISLILMDIQMPELNGIGATREIRKIEKDENRDKTPIIALTAGIFKPEKNECLSAGCDDIITKPVDLDILFSIIEEHIY